VLARERAARRNSRRQGHSKQNKIQWQWRPARPYECTFPSSRHVLSCGVSSSIPGLARSPTWTCHNISERCWGLSWAQSSSCNKRWPQAAVPGCSMVMFQARIQFDVHGQPTPVAGFDATPVQPRTRWHKLGDIRPMYYLNDAQCPCQPKQLQRASACFITMQEVGAQCGKSGEIAIGWCCGACWAQTPHQNTVRAKRASACLRRPLNAKTKWCEHGAEVVQEGMLGTEAYTRPGVQPLLAEQSVDPCTSGAKRLPDDSGGAIGWYCGECWAQTPPNVKRLEGQAITCREASHSRPRCKGRWPSAAFFKTHGQVFVSPTPGADLFDATPVRSPCHKLAATRPAAKRRPARPSTSQAAQVRARADGSIATFSEMALLSAFSLPVLAY